MSQISIKLTTIPKCFVYRLGPRPSAKGYMCKDWPQEDHVWTGKVVIYSKGDQCIVSLEDPKTGSVFASAPVTEDGPAAIERAIDSSRYFIIRVDDGAGHYAFIGVGFETREEGFDFMHTVSEHFRRVRDDKEAKTITSKPRVETDYSLKGKIKVELKLKPTSSHPATTAGGSSTFFPPPDDSSSSFPAPAAAPTSAPALAPASSNAGGGFGFFQPPPSSSSAAPPSSSNKTPSGFDSNSFFSFSSAPPPKQVAPAPSPPLASPTNAFFGAPAPAPPKTTSASNDIFSLFGAAPAAPAASPGGFAAPVSGGFAPAPSSGGFAPGGFAPASSSGGFAPGGFAPSGFAPASGFPAAPGGFQQQQQPQPIFGAPAQQTNPSANAFGGFFGAPGVGTGAPPPAQNAFFQGQVPAPTQQSPFFPGQVPAPVQQQTSALDALGIKW